MRRSLSLLAALGPGRNLPLKGPPSTSKSTILRPITALNGTSLRFVEGNNELTPSKLVGYHSPSSILQEDYARRTSCTVRCRSR